MSEMERQEMVLGVGKEGKGKKYMEVENEEMIMERGIVERIIIQRKEVEEGESMGLMKGEMKEKVDKYMSKI